MSWDGLFTWDQSPGHFLLERECLINSKMLNNVWHQVCGHSGRAHEEASRVL